MPKKISSREEALFETLHDLVFVDYPFLEKYIFLNSDGTPQHQNTIRRALKSLENEGYIKSFPVPKAHVRGADRLAYSLDTQGIQEASEILGGADWDKRWTQRTPTYIYHSIQIAYILMIYKTNIHHAKELEFVDYFSERRAFRNYGEWSKDKYGKKRQSPATVIRPDGAFVLKRLVKEKEFKFLYFVEMERSRQRIENTLEKMFRYNQYVLKKAYKEDFVFGDIDVVRVLFVSNKETERDRLLFHSKKADTKAIEKIQGTLFFASYDDVMANPYGAIWKANNSEDQGQFYHLTQKIEV
ncbi:replication-relaxation family protein [Alkalihalobacillus sp. TS-13]|uniref:replication-relaxation family protein n=1 Tax=Alkalihalobacillus sp. TS-13 TaxID=2842455 RepID=UPI001C8765E8|nr:replication-relaxation family protein [Alkalihalobacillus sp. TS-13]